MLRGGKQFALGLELPDVSLLRQLHPTRDFRTAYEGCVMRDAPVAFWHFDQPGGASLDISGNYYDLLADGSSPTYRQALSCPRGYAIQFTTSQALTRTGPVTVATNNFSVEMWVYPTDLTGSAYSWLFSVGSPSVTRGWSVGINRTTDKLAGVAHNVGLTSDGTNSVTSGAWNHLVWVRDAGTWKTYINGSSDSASLGTVAPGAAASTDPTYINRTNTGSDGLACYVASCAVFETVLSSTQVTNHYNAT